MVITELNKVYYYTVSSSLDAEIRVFKTEEGDYSAEFKWIETEGKTIEQIPSKSTFQELQNEMIPYTDDFGFRVKLKIK